jgi:hypothetical protein
MVQSIPGNPPLGKMVIDTNEILLGGGTPSPAPSQFLDLAYDVSGLGIFLTPGTANDFFDILFDMIPQGADGKTTQPVRFVGITIVPEPGTGLLLLAGLFGLALRRPSSRLG